MARVLGVSVVRLLRMAQPPGFGAYDDRRDAAAPDLHDSCCLPRHLRRAAGEAPACAEADRAMDAALQPNPAATVAGLPSAGTGPSDI